MNELAKKYLFKDGSINTNILNKEAEPFRKFDYTFENFKADFPNGKIQTPIGEVNISAYQFRKLREKIVNGKDRTVFLGLIKPTLERPNFVVDFEDTTVFFKSFKDEKGLLKFVSFTKEQNNEINIVSNYDVRNKKFQLLVLEGKVRYAKGDYDVKSASHSFGDESIIAQNSKQNNITDKIHKIKEREFNPLTNDDIDKLAENKNDSSALDEFRVKHSENSDTNTDKNDGNKPRKNKQ